MLYTLPIIGALIGWITNWIAVKMLFHPKKEIKFLFFSIQGVFPKRQKILAEKLGAIVSRELFSIEDVKDKLKEKSTSPEYLNDLEVQIEEFLKAKLSKISPMIGAFITPKIIGSVKDALMEELKILVPSIIEKLGNQLSEYVDVHEIVKKKVEEFSGDKLEEILNSIMEKEFKFIEIIGGILGFIIGLIQLAIVNLS